MATRRRGYLLVATLAGALAIYVVWLVASAPTLVSQGGADTLVEREARLRMARVAHELEIYRRSHGELPQDLDQAGLGEVADPWGKPLRYKRVGEEDYLLFSVGQDGEADTKDDVRRNASLDADVDTEVLAEADQRRTR
jgi:hypothetical protein